MAGAGAEMFLFLAGVLAGAGAIQALVGMELDLAGAGAGVLAWAGVIQVGAGVLAGAGVIQVGVIQVGLGAIQDMITIFIEADLPLQTDDAVLSFTIITSIELGQVLQRYPDEIILQITDYTILQMLIEELGPPLLELGRLEVSTHG